ncbi:alpha-tocopherol transfer protein-like [Bradysia coprophila]|uniref:alpha-tocopherol transfer protein-like n=1 Tax=Bradysia coprophila TaxID=38358 RepID=UPI00187D7A64|nr:alpha-tocopherol transfer protein-like [Bradysia coprophila]
MELSERVQKVAKKELREDKSARDQCLQQMRDWLSKNEDVEDVRIDDVFLLRFLRTKKFSVPMAQQLLLKYLNLKKNLPKMASELDFLSSPMKEVFENGYLFVSPIRDQYGRRVIISRTAKFDPHIWNISIGAKAHFIAFETLLEDPENQVMGFSHVWDWQGVSTAHLSIWRPIDFEIFKHGEQSWPVRHKAIHLINVPSAVKWALDIGRRLLSNKINDRLTLYSSWSEYNKKCDASYLPKELGGTIPMAEMIQWWIQEMAAKRDIVVQLDKMKLLSDRGITKKHDYNLSPLHAEIRAHMDSVAGSFRKLEVD